MKRYIGVFFLSLLLASQLFAHSGKPKYHVIIDTDGAIDDLRSLSMFLSGNDIRVLAITCSQGNLLPDSVYVKVESLLSTFHHEGIPVGIGNKTGQELPAWAPFAQNISWGNFSGLNKPDVKTNATEILNKTTKNYSEKITLIALGSLKTFADWIKTHPEASDKIDRIIWYNDLEIEKGFNYKASVESYDFIKQSNIQLDIVGNSTEKYVVDATYLSYIDKINSVYAKYIKQVHKQPEVVERIAQKHLKLWDDIVPIYLTIPVLFESEVKENIRFAKLADNLPESIIYEFAGKLLESGATTNNRVFNVFPVDTALYKPDYAKILCSTIEKFGPIEWKAICMTNEIHGHTGIYSILGAKLGIRAMEYFNVGVNNLEVTSFSGSKPPLSCFNDGLQISSGATIGQGLITISDSLSLLPTALFKFNNQTVKISIKPEIADRMKTDIKYAIETYGLLTEPYWRYIEKLAIRYWSELSRYEIFDIVIVS